MLTPPPALPPQTATAAVPPKVEVSVQTVAPVAPPAAIAAPETITPPRPAAPEPPAAPAPVAPPAPRPVTAPAPAPPPTSAVPAAAKASTAPAAPANAAIAQRRQVLEQRLAEIVAKDKAKREAQIQQTAPEQALEYAKQGKLGQAKQVASHPVLSAQVRRDLSRQLAAMQGSSKTPTSAAKSAAPQPNQRTSTASVGVPRSGGSSEPGQVYYSPSPPNVPMLRVPLLQMGNRNLSLVFPLSIPAPITSGFGWRVHPISNEARFHRGVDLGAPLGTPVLAAHVGRVEVADLLDGYGLTVILRHSNGKQETLYAHLSKLFVRPGEQVKPGQVIGLVGSTGYSTGPHLHFEVQQYANQEWVALDPVQQLNLAMSTVAQLPPPKLPAVPVLSNSTLSAKFPNIKLSSFVPANDNPFFLARWIQASINSEQLLMPLTVMPGPVSDVSWLMYPLLDEWMPKSLTLPPAIAQRLALAMPQATPANHLPAVTVPATVRPGVTPPIPGQSVSRRVVTPAGSQALGQPSPPKANLPTVLVPPTQAPSRQAQLPTVKIPSTVAVNRLAPQATQVMPKTQQLRQPPLNLNPPSKPVVKK